MGRAFIITEGIYEVLRRIESQENEKFPLRIPLAQTALGGIIVALVTPIHGGVAERLNAPVLKTGNGKPFVGSNPTPSATHIAKRYLF